MMLKYIIFIVLHNSANSYFVIDAVDRACDMFPVVVNTWGFTQATEKAWEVVYLKNKSAVDAIEAGCSVCEKLQCDGTVGYGGSPDENGETTLDAMIMDGETMNMGAVGALRRVKSAISVARHVMDYTSHSMLVGDQATHFALSMGFKEETLQTDTSYAIWKKWRDHSCQPNFWMNVSPDPKASCGPYKPDAEKGVLEKTRQKSMFSKKNHDTIGMVAIDFKGRIAAGTSTNGARHKIPGRVGDSPIPGAGAYADGKVGAAAATGDGDVMMRFLPSLLAVEEMRKGESPTAAGEYALRRILAYYPNFVGGIVVLRKDGEFGAACHGLLSFPFSVCSHGSNRAAIHTVSCIR